MDSAGNKAKYLYLSTIQQKQFIIISCYCKKLAILIFGPNLPKKCISGPKQNKSILLAISAYLNESRHQV